MSQVVPCPDFSVAKKRCSFLVVLAKVEAKQNETKQKTPGFSYPVPTALYTLPHCTGQEQGKCGSDSLISGKLPPKRECGPKRVKFECRRMLDTSSEHYVQRDRARLSQYDRGIRSTSFLYRANHGCDVGSGGPAGTCFRLIFARLCVKKRTGAAGTRGGRARYKSDAKRARNSSRRRSRRNFMSSVLR